MASFACFFEYKVIEISYVFHMYSTSQFELVTSEMLKRHKGLVATVFVRADRANREPLKGSKQGNARVWCVFQSKTSGGDGKGGLGQRPLRIAKHSSTG